MPATLEKDKGKVLDRIHQMIKNNPDIVVLHLKPEEAVILHGYLQEYHYQEVPEFGEWSKRASYLGRKIEIYEESTT